MNFEVVIVKVNKHSIHGVSAIFLFYPYNYNCELYIFDEPVDVPMRNCCEIDVFLC